MREELKALAEALWLREPRRPVSSIHRQVARDAEKREWPVPSYDQVLAVVRSIDPSLATLSREGTKAHKQKYDLLVRFEASRPNEIWQADHKYLKVWLSDGKGKAKKSWLTARDRVSGSCHVFWYALSGRRRFVPCSTVGETLPRLCGPLLPRTSLVRPTRNSTIILVSALRGTRAVSFGLLEQHLRQAGPWHRHGSPSRSLLLPRCAYVFAEQQTSLPKVPANPHKMREPTEGLEPPACSLRVSRHMFVAVHRCSKIRIGKVNQPYDPSLVFAAVRLGCR